MNVLIVDDNELNLKVADGYIKMLFPEFTTILCDDSRQVLSMLAQHNIDIVLLDIMMPYLSGIDVLEQIKAVKAYRMIQIIMLTALVDDESFEKCFDLGANDYLEKPINSIKLKARLTAAARTRVINKDIIQLVDVLRDKNAELTQVNHELKDAKFNMVKSEKLAAIGELAAGVAHEINNPIGYVGSNVTTMSKYLNKMKEYIVYVKERIEGYDGTSISSFEDFSNDLEERFKALKIHAVIDDLEDITEDCNDGIEKISKIVRALSGFARNGLADEKLYCDYEEVVSQILIIIKNEYKYAIEIKTEFEPMKDVLMNKAEYSQVVLNILINAIHAIKEAGKDEFGLIRIKSYTESEYTCLSIKDNGLGISQENINKIFDPFFTTKISGQGTGLGLSISHNIIVDKHNGQLIVNSEVGKGTEFIIKLPVSN